MTTSQLQAAIREIDPTVADLIGREDERQQHSIRLIPSENHAASPAVKRLWPPASPTSTVKVIRGSEHQGQAFYGFFGNRRGHPAGGGVVRLSLCQCPGPIRSSGNLAVYTAFMKPTRGAKSWACGWTTASLTHGSPVSVTGQWFEILHYGCNDKDVLDMEEIRRMALDSGQHPAMRVYRLPADDRFRGLRIDCQGMRGDFFGRHFPHRRAGGRWGAPLSLAPHGRGDAHHPQNAARAAGSDHPLQNPGTGGGDR